MIFSRQTLKGGKKAVYLMNFYLYVSEMVEAQLITCNWGSCGMYLKHFVDGKIGNKISMSAVWSSVSWILVCLTFDISVLVLDVLCYKSYGHSAVALSVFLDRKSVV